jgi:hypothetical protein
LLQEPAVVSNVLSALDRIEAQEQEIRRRWFGSSVELQTAVPAPPDAAAGVEAGETATASQLVSFLFICGCRPCYIVLLQDHEILNAWYWLQMHAHVKHACCAWLF